MKNLKSQVSKNITGITQATQERPKAGRVLCHYLSNQGHCEQTPPLPTAFPSRLLWKERQELHQVRTRTSEVTVQSTHTFLECPESEETLDEADLWDLAVCSPDKLYFPPFPIPSAHTPVQSLTTDTSLKCRHAFLGAKITTA